ncbi:MAG TPA: hypothetical protein VFS33_01595 [Gemmatimonadales bacterium]|nr:hypothetical protein [Gemmatimonadales bacterium]
MRIILAGSALLLALVACNRRVNEGAATRTTKDTVVTARQMVDTSVVKTDTTVKVDTTHKAGKRPTKVDTVKRSTQGDSANH